MLTVYLQTSPNEHVASPYSWNSTTHTLWNTLAHLHGCDGALLGGGDSLLHGTHVSGQGGLVTHSRGDTTQQGRHLHTQYSSVVLSVHVSAVDSGKNMDPDCCTPAPFPSSAPLHGMTFPFLCERNPLWAASNLTSRHFFFPNQQTCHVFCSILPMYHPHLRSLFKLTVKQVVYSQWSYSCVQASACIYVQICTLSLWTTKCAA